jgi:hypothetical protein
MQTSTAIASLLTATPDEGFALAIKLSRLAVKLTQPDAEIRTSLRSEYEQDAMALVAASQVVATHFATIAAANDYWKGSR